MQIDLLQRPKCAVLIGAHTPQGQLLAAQLLHQGWSVAAASSEDRTSLLEHENLLSVRMDINDHSVIVDGVKQAIDRFGHVDALVIVPGASPLRGEIMDLNEAIELAFEKAITHALNATLAVLPVFRQQGYGVISNVVFRGSEEDRLSGAWYVSRFVMEGLVRYVNSPSRGLNVDVRLCEIDVDKAAFESGLPTLLYGSLCSSAAAGFCPPSVQKVIDELESVIDVLRGRSREAPVTILMDRLMDEWVQLKACPAGLS